MDIYILFLSSFYLINRITRHLVLLLIFEFFLYSGRLERRWSFILRVGLRTWGLPLPLGIVELTRRFHVRHHLPFK